MRVLFDQNVPRNLRQYLAGHEVFTAAQMGWQELENGQLLKVAEDDGFDVFLTGDQNMTYQQNMKRRKIAIVELTKNNWPSVKPQVAQIALAVDSSVVGRFQTVDCDLKRKLR
jgi:hypothetical protein